jgi:formylmethanofuran dehydrogenase subunit B
VEKWKGGKVDSTSSTCLGCGCACDDIEVVVEDVSADRSTDPPARVQRIVEAQNACALGAAWFGDGSAPARVRALGREASIDEALAAVAGLLEHARRPLIYLAPEITCEAQREAIAIADGLRASLDSVTSATALQSILAAQEQGRAAATLGEVRNRADVLVCWGVDPSLRYPRYWSRYAPEPAGIHLPAGRASRKVVAVDIGDSRGPADADLRLAIPPRDEVPTLTTLAASVRLKADPTYGRARELGPVVTAGQYVVFVADAEPQDGRDAGGPAALITLTQALNGTTRCALSILRAGGNRSGADACLTSQTGYPTAVDFARGYPRYRPFDGTAGARLARGEVDAVLIIGSADLIPTGLASAMARVSHAAIGPRASASVFASGVALVDTAVAGIHEAGTALRMDDVPLPVRKCLAGPAEATVVVRALRERINR